MPGTPRKTPKTVAAVEEETPERESFKTPTSVEGLAAIVVELLEHVVLRDADERARLRAQLTGGEVPDADEASEGSGDGEE